MLVLALALFEALGVTIDHKPGGSARGVGKDRVEVGVAAVGDPLLVAVEQVADDLAVLLDPGGGGAQGGEVAARFRLGGAVGHQQAFFTDLAHPACLLFLGTAEDNGIAAEEGGKHAGSNSNIDAG